LLKYITFTRLDPIHLLTALSKAADVILFVIDADEGVTEVGNAILHQIFSQGMPAVMGLVTGLEDVPLKRRNDAKKAATAVFQSQFAEEPRICPLDNGEDADQVIRFVCGQKLREIWREGMPYLVPESLKWEPLVCHFLLTNLWRTSDDWPLQIQMNSLFSLEATLAPFNFLDTLEDIN